MVPSTVWTAASGGFSTSNIAGGPLRLGMGIDYHVRGFPIVYNGDIILIVYIKEFRRFGMADKAMALAGWRQFLVLVEADELTQQRRDDSIAARIHNETMLMRYRLVEGRLCDILVKMTNSTLALYNTYTAAWTNDRSFNPGAAPKLIVEKLGD